MPSELPDDPRDWPKNPFELLGVEPGADETAIRKAYTKLIRRFKPEHHPIQFALVRDAYEACKQRMFWFFPSVPELRSEATAVERADRPKVAEPEPAERFWKQAIEGRLAAAYEGLQALAAGESVATDIALRLYWLLAIDPKLDASRSRHDWLARALRESQLGHGPLELYRRELEAFARDAFDGPCAELMAIDAPLDRLIAAARVRLPAAIRTGRLSHLDQDLKILRDRMNPDRESEWLALLVAALDWTAPLRNNPVFDLLHSEIAKLKHLELGHSYQFDRIDRTLHWSAEAVAAEGPDREAFVRILRDLWASHGEGPRPEHVPELTRIATEPWKYLRLWDEYFEARGPVLALFAEELLNANRYDPAPGHSQDILRGLARRVGNRFGFSWPVLRGPLAAFAIEEGIRTAEWAEACALDSDYRVRTLAEALHNDMAFRLVVAAGRRAPGRN